MKLETKLTNGTESRQVHLNDGVMAMNKRMSTTDFERERARLQGLYGGSRKEAGARYEQALAKLFYVSGWTQEELAKKEGKGKSTISRLLIFGRFVGFLETENDPDSDLSPTGDKDEKVPEGLTERYFRGFWDQTETGSGSSGGNERVRFIAVIRLMQEAALTPRTHRNADLGKQIVAAYADGNQRQMRRSPGRRIEPAVEKRTGKDGKARKHPFTAPSARGRG